MLYTAIAALTGCEQQTDSRPGAGGPVHAVFVLGSTSNTPVLNLSAVADLIRRICAQGGSTISLIVADGQLRLFDEITAPEVDASYSKAKQKQIIEARVAEITAVAGEALAREGILDAGKPESLAFATDLPTQFVYEGLPEVDTVPVVMEGGALQKKSADAEPDKAPEVDAVIFNETVISFEPGTADLKDPKAAMAAIHEVSRSMEEHPEKKALLIGCTARWGSEKDSLSLSFARAAAIRNLFVNAGIREDRLKVLGTGWMSPFYKNDQAKDSSLDETVAPGNRSTIWIDTESSLAKLVLNSADADKFVTE